ncbi:MAG: hypothetical protein H7Z72_19185 [Bacteroidetes bacterium]|nr:hypothetical protein [Fibrella sp.]
MKKLIGMGITILTAVGACAQSSVTVNQSGSGQESTVAQQGAGQSAVINQSGGAGNRAVISQQGAGNRVSINQRNTSTSDSSGQPGNRVSLRVDSTTQTAINQHNETGPNSVELSQAGQSSAVINQSSGTHDNTVTTLPGQKPPTPRNRAPKRRNRR